MCKYEEIEGWHLSNDKTIREIDNAVCDEVERIYLEAWLMDRKNSTFTTLIPQHYSLTLFISA